MYISNGSCQAKVYQSYSKNHINVEIIGAKKDRGKYLYFIRDTFRQLHKPFPALKIKEEIIYGDTWLDYKTLLWLEEKNKPYYHVELQEDLPITDILNGYFTRMERESEKMGKVNYQSVFISYSFKDKAFANQLYEKLKVHGVFAFLYEKDAPGGKKLKKIMAEGVEKHERLLFISSENSIRSEACQYELTLGRKKQERDWETIYFPIHIDNFLFEIEKDDIKPRGKQDEYWENITEIKEVNSMDFSKFNSSKFDEGEFDKQVKALIKELHK